eukprot:2345413-Rhodomonas_salina.3
MIAQSCDVAENQVLNCVACFSVCSSGFSLQTFPPSCLSSPFSCVFVVTLLFLPWSLCRVHGCVCACSRRVSARLHLFPETPWLTDDVRIEKCRQQPLVCIRTQTLHATDPVCLVAISDLTLGRLENRTSTWLSGASSGAVLPHSQVKYKKPSFRCILHKECAC